MAGTHPPITCSTKLSSDSVDGSEAKTRALADWANAPNPPPRSEVCSLVQDGENLTPRHVRHGKVILKAKRVGAYQDLVCITYQLGPQRLCHYERM